MWDVMLELSLQQLATVVTLHVHHHTWGLVNNSVSGMSANTTVEGVTTPIPHASQYNSSTVANADGNMSVAGGLTTSSLPIIYPLQNNIYSPVPMLNQLPPITQYSGEEQPDGETFQDWLEQFESVAQLGGWSNHAKLVNRSTRLRGSAYSFYRSCTTEQRNDYKLLVEQLTKRFTPVRIQPIQSQLFHDRQQKPKATVHEYAEALKKLFVKAYSNLARGGQEGVIMGQSVLANQFVAGLRPELKAKVVGSEGNMEQLLMKARFEEAKQKELTRVTPGYSRVTPKNSQRRFGGQRDVATSRSQTTGASTTSSENLGKKYGKSKRSCFNCGLTTHLIKDCPYPIPPGRDKETRRSDSAVAVVTPENEIKMISERITVLQKELKEKQVVVAMEEATVNGVSFSDTITPTKLGPAVYSEMTVNGVNVTALIDTGSPVSIMSLKKAVQILALRKGEFNSRQKWKETMIAQFQTSTVMLRSYSGDALNVVTQLPMILGQGDQEVRIISRIDTEGCTTGLAYWN